jgi:uncharacterized protein (TIGR00255 family)
MTGFGGAEERGRGIIVGIDLRTVNHRYFKLQSKAPDELSSLVGPAEAEIRKAVRRGSVYFTARLEVTIEGARSLVDEKLLGGYVELCRRLGRKHGLPGAESLPDLLSLPGVVRSPEEGIKRDLKAAAPVFHKALERALAALEAMREKEGRAIQKDLLKRIHAAERALRPIQKGLPAALRDLEDRLFDRVNELLGRRGLTLEKTDLAREAALLAERTDVTEEIERIRSHLLQAKDLLRRGGEVGRQLDFLAQELLREVTTMGAKVGSYGLSEHVLALKVEIDRLKEQVQNIE